MIPQETQHLCYSCAVSDEGGLVYLKVSYAAKTSIPTLASVPIVTSVLIEASVEEKIEIQKGLDILSSAKLPRPSIFIPPAWHLSRQAVEALKELNFSISEAMTRP